MGFTKINVLSITELFVQQIENMILSGELSVGEQLPPARELAVRMGVSRAVVSAGLVELEKLGFVEVKARHGSEYGTGREAVTAAKQRNIIKAAQIYAVNTGLIDNFIRFDVIEVDLDTLQVEHIIDAFRLN